MPITALTAFLFLSDFHWTGDSINGARDRHNSPRLTAGQRPSDNYDNWHQRTATGRLPSSPNKLFRLLFCRASGPCSRHLSIVWTWKFSYQNEISAFFAFLFKRAWQYHITWQFDVDKDSFALSHTQFLTFFNFPFFPSEGRKKRARRKVKCVLPSNLKITGLLLLKWKRQHPCGKAGALRVSQTVQSWRLFLWFSRKIASQSVYKQQTPVLTFRVYLVAAFAIAWESQHPRNFETVLEKNEKWKLIEGASVWALRASAKRIETWTKKGRKGYSIACYLHGSVLVTF